MTVLIFNTVLLVQELRDSQIIQEGDAGTSSTLCSNNVEVFPEWRH